MMCLTNDDRKLHSIFKLLFCISCSYVVYGIYRQLSEKQTLCYPFLIDYPLTNLPDIVNERITNGTTSVKPINSLVYKYHSVYSVQCSNLTELVVLVKSHVENFQQRIAIRSTWARCHDKNVKVIFVLGYLEKAAEAVKNEFDVHEDIIQVSNHEKYKSVIYKVMFSYDWVVSACSNSRYVLFVDEDFYVNIPNILTFSREKMKNNHNVMFGHKQCNKSPIRNPSSKYGKYFITKQEYPYDIFPPFLSGGSVLTNTNVVRKIYLAFPFVKPIWLDDVYVSIIANKLKVKLVMEERLAIEELIRKDVKYFMVSHHYSKPEVLFQGFSAMNRFHILDIFKEHRRCFSD